MAQSSYTDYDENRPSWREIDRRKDKRHDPDSRFRSQPKKPNRITQEDAKKNYLNKVNQEIFSGKKGHKDFKKRQETLQKAIKAKKWQSTLENYITDFGFPDDWETLVLLLDVRDETVVLQSINAICAFIAEQSPTRKTIFRGKLKIIRMLAKDKNLREKIKTILNSKLLSSI